MGQVAFTYGTSSSFPIEANMNIFPLSFAFKITANYFTVDSPVSANFQQTHNQICIQCLENGETKGCVMIIHPTWNLESVESHIIQKSSRRCFHQLSGEYTVAVFGQSAGGVLQKVPLNVSVVSISEPTTCTSNEIL